MNIVYNCDCMEYMATCKDKQFDLAIVDPPYGIGINTMNYTTSGAVRASRKSATFIRDYRNKGNWDITPEKIYFDELFRISKNQIIWGGNYFTDKIPVSKSFIIWDKRTDEKYNNDYADCEYAWCNYGVARVFRYLYSGMLQGKMKNKEYRFHATQKPIVLYKWVLQHYAKPGNIILDTHIGSGSIRIACYDLGFDIYGCENDPEIWKAQEARYQTHIAQSELFGKDEIQRLIYETDK